MSSYLEKTNDVLKAANFTTQKVETFNMHAGVRQDLYGFIDLLAMHPSHGIVGVQVCGPSDYAEHVKKMLGPRREALILWLASGGRAILVGWRKLKGRWTPRYHEFLLGSDELPEITPSVLNSLHAADRNSLESVFVKKCD